MSDAVRIAQARTDADWREVQRLCWDYRDFLLSMPDPDRAAVTNAYPEGVYADLMADLQRLHSAPNGCARLVWLGDRAIGCGMLYRFAPEIAEVKRVYLSEDVRGLGTGCALMAQLIADCRAMGFAKIYLDTGRLLRGAITLYEQLGFQARGPYQDVPAEIEPLLRFFELEL